MSSRTLQVSDAVHEYLLRETMREPPLLAELRAETAGLPNAGMQISPEQGQFMRLLAELLGARRALEVGTFTGYSALCLALALPEDGRLICCDVNRTFTDVAERYWERAGVRHKIDLRIAPAIETLDALLAGGADARRGGPDAAAHAGAVGAAAGTFDLVFIDADKTNYDAYYERGLRLLRPGGLVLIDNALWSGRVADAAAEDADTAAIRALNRKIRDDERVTASLVPIGDGLMAARKVGV